MVRIPFLLLLPLSRNSFSYPLICNISGVRSWTAFPLARTNSNIRRALVIFPRSILDYYAHLLYRLVSLRPFTARLKQSHSVELYPESRHLPLLVRSLFSRWFEGKPAHWNDLHTHSYVRITLLFFLPNTKKSSKYRPKRHLWSVRKIPTFTSCRSLNYALENKSSPYIACEIFTE